MSVRIIIEDAHSTHTERVVDVGNVGLYLLSGFFQESSLLLLLVVRLHHLRDVSACSDDTVQMVLPVADGTERHLIVVLSAYRHLWNTLVVVFGLVDVGNRRHDSSIQFIQVYFSVCRDILDIHLPHHQCLTALYPKTLQSLVVDVCQDTVLVIEDHVDERGIKHGMETQRQSAIVFPSDDILCIVALNAEQCLGITQPVLVEHRDMDLIDRRLAIRMLLSSDVDGARVLFPVTYGNEQTVQVLEVIMMVEL